MKLIRFGTSGLEKTGVIIENIMYDTSAFGEDYDEKFFSNNGIEPLEQFISANNGNLPMPEKGIRLGSPVARPSKIVCIGLNYADHARETNAVIPKEPIIFFKATTALCGPNDD